MVCVCVSIDDSSDYFVVRKGCLFVCRNINYFIVGRIVVFIVSHPQRKRITIPIKVFISDVACFEDDFSFNIYHRLFCDLD